MRILFVSGTAVGGSARSTRELAERLVARGHAVALLFRVEAAPRRRWVHKRAVNLTTKLGASPLARPVAFAGSLIGRRARRGPERSGVEAWETILPENSLPGVMRGFRPDVVVASSIGRTAWRQIRAELRAKGIPNALYLREASALGHLSISQAPPDLLLANAEVHARAAMALGLNALTIPSVVALDRCLVESSRERVLFVNPVVISGRDIALALAAARPDVAFTFVESWPLEPEDRAALVASVDRLPNVELRPSTSDPRALYADARLLLAPYLTNGRPRVVLEAQANGIPVLASDLPALHEAVGAGGAVVAPDAPTTAWVDALSALLDDPARYDAVCAVAREHARRAEVDTEAIVSAFEVALTELVARRGARADATTPGPAEPR